MKFAARSFRENPPDVLIANYIWSADVLDLVGPEVLKMIVTHDVQHERAASFQEAGLGSQIDAWDAATEARLLTKAQVLIAIQEEEAAALRKLAPACEVITVPLPVTPQDGGGKQISGRCLFIGSDQLHNVHGLYWFLGEVWPQVLDAVPHATLHVCGSICSMFPTYSKSLQNVRFMGHVKDVAPEYAATEVCVVPNLVGSGLKIKLVEALGHGRACVATHVGLQGIRELAGRAILAAGSSAEFASAVTQLLNDVQLRRGFEVEARRFVVERLAPEVVCRPLVERLRDAERPSRRRTESPTTSAGL